MRIMAVDPGDVRTGIAVSDASLTLTGDAWVINCKNTAQLARQIAQEAASRDVSCILVGYPRNMNGTVGVRAAKSEKLAESLVSICNAEIKLWDERLTTASAHNILSETGKRGKKRKNAVDAVAASLILESYLASLKYQIANTGG